MRKFYLALLAATVMPSAAYGKCQVAQLLELKVTMHGTEPLAEIGINGRSLPFIVDSGAFFSTISPGTAAELGLRLESTGLEVQGIGGSAGKTSIARVKSLDLGGVALHDIRFIVGGSETGVGGLLGQNILGIGDVEYDLGHGAIRIMRSNGCSGNDNFAYWAGQAPVSDLSIEPRDAFHPHTIGVIYLNGAKVRAIFDTGASTSILSLDAARRAGITTSSAGVERLGLARGIGRSMVETWLAPFDNVKIGTEEIRHVKLRIGNIGMEEADMLLGADFFLSHRVYVAMQCTECTSPTTAGPSSTSSPLVCSISQARRRQLRPIRARSRPMQPVSAAGAPRKLLAAITRPRLRISIAQSRWNRTMGATCSSAPARKC